MTTENPEPKKPVKKPAVKKETDDEEMIGDNIVTVLDGMTKKAREIHKWCMQQSSPSTCDLTILAVLIMLQIHSPHSVFPIIIGLCFYIADMILMACMYAKVGKNYKEMK